MSKAEKEFVSFVRTGDLRLALEKSGQNAEMIDLVVFACRMFSLYLHPQEVEAK